MIKTVMLLDTRILNFRKEWTKEQALIFKEAVDLLKLAHQQY